MNQNVAIYARVSPTKHKNTISDLHDSLNESIKICTQDAEREGNTVVATYVDEYISGKASKHMADFNKMLFDARNKTNTAEIGDHKTTWDRIYCRRVNRFGRNRADMISAEIELSSLDITLKFVELGIDTGVPMGKGVMGLMAEIAESDRKEILENTKRGRERAMAEGIVKFGQPKKEFDIIAVRRLRLAPVSERLSWKVMSDMFHVSPGTMIKGLKEAGHWDYEKRTVI